MLDYLLHLSHQPAWIFVAIILASYVLEDLAIITAAVMAVDQIISVPLALYAILIGIISGDVVLYGPGYILTNNKIFKQWIIKKNRQKHFATFFGHNLIKDILIIRFIPGLRFLCYTSCGVFRAHFGKFIIGVTMSAVIWVLVVFTLIYQLGSSVLLEYSGFKWLLIPMALLLLIYSNKKIMLRIKKQSNLV